MSEYRRKIWIICNSILYLHDKLFDIWVLLVSHVDVSNVFNLERHDFLVIKLNDLCLLISYLYLSSIRRATSYPLKLLTIWSFVLFLKLAVLPSIETCALLANTFCPQYVLWTSDYQSFHSSLQFPESSTAFSYLSDFVSFFLETSLLSICSVHLIAFILP